jgi:hypothetical protein
MTSEIQAKRLAPAGINPIEKDGLIFLHKFQSQDDGYAVYILAKKSEDKSILWKTKIYQKRNFSR